METGFRNSRAKLGIGASVLSLLTAGALQAQPVATADGVGSEGLADIIVTARRSKESLQTVPVAVSALDAIALRASQITSVTDLQKKVPALATTTGGPGGQGIVFLGIRGQSNVGGTSTADFPVATYIDGVYFARSTSGNLALFDLERVEVLRGPQGTLFGRNTTGGALSITTAKPGGQMAGNARLEYGNYNAVQADGAITLPLQGDELAIRVAGRYARHDGYYENRTTNKETSNLDYFWGLRGTLRWAPTSLPLTFTLTGDASEFKDDGQAVAIVAANPATPVGAALQGFVVGSGGRYDETYIGYSPLSRDPESRGGQAVGKTRGVAGTLEVDVGDVKLKSITAWRQAIARNTIDLDGSPIAVYTASNRFDQHQWSEEFQGSTTIGNLDLIVGAMYFKEKGKERSIASNRSPSGIGGEPGLFSAESKSLFAQANYHITDELRITGGYRYTWDKRKLERQGLTDFLNPTSCSPGIPLTPQGCSLPLEAKFSFPAWLAGADYKVNNGIFLYVKASQASLSGGFNLREAPAGREAFNPEKRREVELGAKIDALDRRLRVNVAAFSGVTSDAQRQASGARADGSLTQFTQNTGKVKSQGVELDVTAVPWSGMELTGGLAYLDAKYKKGSFVEPRLIGGNLVIVDRSNELVANSPKWALSLGATQKFDVPMGVVTVHADYTYIARNPVMQVTASPGASAPVIAATEVANRTGILPSYSLVSGRVGLRMENGLEFAVWARNLFNEKYYTFAFNGFYLPLGVSTASQGIPRTYGISVGFDF